MVLINRLCVLQDTAGQKCRPCVFSKDLHTTSLRPRLQLPIFPFIYTCLQPFPISTSNSTNQNPILQQTTSLPSYLLTPLASHHRIDHRSSSSSNLQPPTRQKNRIVIQIPFQISLTSHSPTPETTTHAPQPHKPLQSSHSGSHSYTRPQHDWTQKRNPRREASHFIVLRAWYLVRGAWLAGGGALAGW